MDLLNQQIQDQGAIVRDLKSTKADKAQVDVEVQKLLQLKKQLKEMSVGEDEGRGRMVLKAPKGMRDFGPHQMQIRERVMSQVIACFKKHGARGIDTPVCELREVLTGKYGEDSKLIFDLQDQGGELLSLRYDLTVPFARFLAQNKLSHIKRYQIGKVYRRDNPAMERGRYREFYQCDFDIAGPSDDMIADSECIRVACEVLQSVGLNDFLIKINHRSIIGGVFEVSGVPDQLFKPICSAIDKLDKMSWSDVRKEMLEKGLNEDAADKIGEFVVLNGSSELVNKLLSEGPLAGNNQSKQGLEEVQLLFELCQVMGVDGLIQFDLSLARGLDYYTGIIYEAVLTNSEVGSIAAGGRYDGLVGILAENPDDKRKQVPCVGISIGIERIFAILEKTSPDPKTLYSTHCYVASIGNGMVAERMRLATLLWDAGLNVEQSFKRKPRILDQIQDCESLGIPVALIIGEDEVKNGKVKLKNVATRQETVVDRSEVVDKVRDILNQMNRL